MPVDALFPKIGTGGLESVIESVMALPTRSYITPLRQQLDRVAQAAYCQLGDIPAELRLWARRSGLTQGKTELRKVLAQQTALAALLLDILEALPSEDKAHIRVAETLAALPFRVWVEQHSFSDIQAVIKSLRETLPEDILGRLYEELTPQAERRMLGQHWTPLPIVDFMTRWATQAGPRVLEPAVGSGRFVQAFERMSVRGISPYICAYEISPLVLLVAQVNAALSKPSQVILDFRLEDFLSSRSDMTFDAVVCNPPYTRHHHLSEALKEMSAEEVERAFGVRPSGFSSLFVYFFLHALTQIRENGRLAFITPSELYEASYAHPVKTILKRHATPAAIIVFDDATQIFEGVDTAGCITLLERSVIPGAETALIKLRIWPGTEILLETLEAKRDLTASWGSVRFVAAHKLRAPDKWSNMRQASPTSASLPPLASFATVMRGIATGANDYFCLSDEEVKKYDIPKEYLQPVITKTRTVQNYSLTLMDMDRLRQQGKKVWLFTCYGERRNLPESVCRYLERGEALRLHQRSLLRKKRRWYTAERRDPPPILFTYLSRGKTRFIYNAAGVQALNAFLLVYPHRRIASDERRIKALAAILNASATIERLRTVGRSYGGDTVKLEPRELDRLPVLDPGLLSLAEVDELNILFDTSCQDVTNQQAQHVLDVQVNHLIVKYADTPAVTVAAQGSLFG